MSKKYLISILFVGLCAVTTNVQADEAVSSKATAAAALANQSPITIGVDQYSENLPISTLDSFVKHSITFSLSADKKTEFENTAYCPTSKLFCTITLTNNQRRHLHLTSETMLDQNALKAYVSALAKKVDTEPSDAKFQVQDGKVATFAEAQKGITLDQDKSVETLMTALSKDDLSQQQTIALPFASKKADTDYGDANSLGISSLIGEGTSNFKGSTASRIYNIKAAISHFNGLLIKPGEEFSFVKNLGEVDAEHGYKPELVIKQGVTEPEFGGGICQVSTTAFRAAIYSGLKITARKNHAYPVSYYNPQGMDSTVYIPQPDLKFKNNTPGYILIQVKIVGTVLTFDFYGTDDGRKTTVDGPYITDKQPDGAMKAHFTQHVVDKDGKEFITDVFNSSYNSPYKYPHPGGTVLTVKPSNWSDDEWKAYKKTIKEMNQTAAN